MSRFRKSLLLVGAAVLTSAGVAGAVDLKAGEKVFGKCASCHAVGDNAKNKVGPQLNELIGRQAGTAEGYSYSKAMVDAGSGGLAWDEANLKAFLTKPRDLVKGTKMAFAGLKREDDLANVIGYLATFSKKQAEAAPAAEKAEDSAAAKNEAQPKSADPAPAAAQAGDAAPGAGARYKRGRLATPDEIAAWDIDVRPDGLGLPEGRGTVAQGMEIFDANCASCHGDFGEAVGRWPVLAGGKDTLEDERPEKTIGSYWPYLSTVYDYVRRAMPFGNARSLSNDDVYALTAYLLFLNDIVTDESFELSKENFADIKLPNEGNFIDDDRAQEPFYAKKAEPCMQNCAPGKAEIKTHAAILDVTPENADEDEHSGGGID